jgi:RNA polymerase sigma factor (sigma-70 family)
MSTATATATVTAFRHAPLETYDLDDLALLSKIGTDREKSQAIAEILKKCNYMVIGFCRKYRSEETYSIILEILLSSLKSWNEEHGFFGHFMQNVRWNITQKVSDAERIIHLPENVRKESVKAKKELSRVERDYCALKEAFIRAEKGDTSTSFFFAKSCSDLQDLELSSFNVDMQTYSPTSLSAFESDDLNILGTKEYSLTGILLKEAIASLRSPRERRIVRMLAEEYTMSEIASKIGCTVQNVSIIIAKVRKNLCKILK